MLVPKHLEKYVVEQSYHNYSPEDHAVWRYILKHLTSFLTKNAHPCYMDGIKKTGITIEEIPKIENINKHLQEFGWQAVPVSGFIPPAAFMEFQSQGFLPIASDMRTLEHLLYTPAPDIVHEAAGHAPILIDVEFSNYLRQYSQVANKAIIGQEDLKQYSLIRKLSDLKESPNSTAMEIATVETELMQTSQQQSYVSEAALLSRMNWWTAEYGLIGDVKNPKIFGAGLLSSLGESRSCLSESVKKIPLTIDCINYSYDITEPQPQLFVTPTFENLSLVLEELAKKMSFQIGGIFGLERAQEAKTVTTVQLDSGVQISGILSSFYTQNEDAIFIKFSSPTQISYNNKELSGHHKEYHAHGYSSPLGPLDKVGKSLNLCTKEDLKYLGIELNKPVEFKFNSGIHLKGTTTNLLFKNEKLLLISFKNCTLKRGDELLFSPDWGNFDLVTGNKISSVFGGAADRLAYGEFDDDFTAKRVPQRNYTDKEIKVHNLYRKLKAMRENQTVFSSEIKQVISECNILSNIPWLVYFELLELFEKYNYKEVNSEKYKQIVQHAELEVN
ncbi:MAG: aromatic amino acid hydroxylase [Bdellovibrionales bacterium]|nr:aromatic amino acid hydroxylase [Bdellovibrionales bacterium]